MATPLQHAWLRALSDDDLLMGARSLATGFDDTGWIDGDIAAQTIIELADRLERRSYSDARDVVLSLRDRVSR